MASKQSQEFRNLAGHFTLQQVSLRSLQLSDTDLTAQPIFVLDATNLPPYKFDGFLSTVQFRQIAFDFERQEFSWMTNDKRRDLVRSASISADVPLDVALSMEPASKAEARSVWSNEETGDARRWLRVPFRSADAR